MIYYESGILICWRHLRIHSKSYHPNILYNLTKKKNHKNTLVVHKFSIVEIFEPVGIQ